jgi:hypothetical protein
VLQNPKTFTSNIAAKSRREKTNDTHIVCISRKKEGKKARRRRRRRRKRRRKRIKRRVLKRRRVQGVEQHARLQSIDV